MTEKANHLRILAVLATAALLPSISIAQTGMAAGSRIYIDPGTGAQSGFANPATIWPLHATLWQINDPGFAIYLTAAIRAKNVNAIITTDRTKAAYILETTSSHMKSLGGRPSIIDDWTAPVLPQNVKAHDDASVRLVNVATGDVVFAYAVDRNNTAHGMQTAAESCAKHLKDAVAMGLTQTTGNQKASLGDRLAAWPRHADPAMSFGIY